MTLDESNMGHASNVMALLLILIEKGICTEEEFKKAQATATAAIDQEHARKKNEN